jgi:hypothetical protein
VPIAPSSRQVVRSAIKPKRENQQQIVSMIVELERVFLNRADAFAGRVRMATLGHIMRERKCEYQKC